jgi:hypothetical protein
MANPGGSPEIVVNDVKTELTMLSEGNYKKNCYVCSLQNNIVRVQSSTAAQRKGADLFTSCSARRVASSSVE